MLIRPAPVLKRFAKQFFKGSPLVPAEGATLNFYKQGATVSVGITLPNNTVTTVQVYNTGALQQDDEVQVGTDTTKTLTVDAVDPDANTVDLTNQTGGPVTLGLDVRLVRTGPDPALIYDDPLGSTTGSGSKSVEADGWVIGYLREYRYDFRLSGSGVTPRVFPDADGSWVMR